MIVVAIFGAMFLFVGLTMYTRGWIYFIKPEGKLAEKRKKRNLKMGWPTDMKLFGRKVRRVGFLTTLIGGALVAWYVADLTADDAAAKPPAETPEESK